MSLDFQPTTPKSQSITLLQVPTQSPVENAKCSHEKTARQSVLQRNSGGATRYYGTLYQKQKIPTKGNANKSCVNVTLPYKPQLIV